MIPERANGLTGEKLVIERIGNRVILTMVLADDYAAIETLEKLFITAREGFVLLNIETVG